MTYAKLILVGRLGRDPEMRYTPSGSAVTNFSIATDENWTKDGEKQKRTTWWRISVFGKSGEACNEYLKKGNQVLVEGRLNIDAKTGGPRVYEKNDGTSGASFEVVALTVKFLGGNNRGEATAEAETEATTPAEGEEEFPF